MPDEPEQPKHPQEKDGSKAVEGKVMAPPPTPDVPADIAEALSKIGDPGAKTLLSMIVARSTTSFGPDPETAKILVAAEQHEEDCHLAGYKANLENREKQNVRDHEYRVKKLNREFWMSIAALIAAVGVCGVGVYLIVIGQSTLGSNLLVGGAGLLLYILKGNASLGNA
jgi:hypothetical protein